MHTMIVRRESEAPESSNDKNVNALGVPYNLNGAMSTMMRRKMPPVNHYYEKANLYPYFQPQYASQVST